MIHYVLLILVSDKGSAKYSSQLSAFPSLIIHIPMTMRLLLYICMIDGRKFPRRVWTRSGYILVYDLNRHVDIHICKVCVCVCVCVYVYVCACVCMCVCVFV